MIFTDAPKPIDPDVTITMKRSEAIKLEAWLNASSDIPQGSVQRALYLILPDS